MALRDINLIAPDILERRYFLHHLFMWCLGLIAVAAIILGIYRYQTRLFYEAKHNRQGGENLPALLVARTAEVGKAQAELNLARKEWAQLGILAENRPPYHSVVAKLAEIMNDQTALQQLAVDSGKDRLVHVKLLGSSRSHETLADFIQRLSDETMFRGVDLKYSQESEARTSVPGKGPVQFHIEFNIVGTKH